MHLCKFNLRNKNMISFKTQIEKYRKSISGYTIQFIEIVLIFYLVTSCIPWDNKENKSIIQQMLLMVELEPDSALMLLNSALFIETEKNSMNNRSKSRLWIFAGLLGIVTVLFSIAVFNCKTENLRQKKTLSKTECEIEKIRERNKELQAAFMEKSGIFKDIVILIPNLMKIHDVNVIAGLNAITSKLSMQKFIEITNELYPGFTEKLKNLSSNNKLTEREIAVCCLSVCGFSNYELALFIFKKKDTQSVIKLKNRIRKKLGISPYQKIQQFLLEKITGV